MKKFLSNYLLVLSVAFCNSIVTKMTKRGAFILFEGVDRCGKSTQASLVTDKSNKIRPTELIRYPDRTSSIGQVINAYLQSSQNLSDRAIHLLFSANRWESIDGLNEKLTSGKTIVSIKKLSLKVILS